MRGLTIATAGWAIPRAVAEAFPVEGSGLQRYGARLAGVEINSTFYRSHRASTYTRWRDSTPDGFRFAVKLPKSITHEARLIGAGEKLAAFLSEASQLGEKLGPLLIQLPPSLLLSPLDHESFLGQLRDLWPGFVALEPRHASWFEPEGEALLRAYRVSRVAADPALHPGGGRPGGWRGFAYWRLHGSPRTYYSSYDDGRLGPLAAALRDEHGEAWCVFDNTASGAAASDAVRLQTELAHG